MRLYSIIGFVLVVAGWVSWQQLTSSGVYFDTKYYGVSLESPALPIDSSRFNKVSSLNPSHVAIIPYAFSKSNEPRVYYDRNHRWWGESYAGVAKLIEMAHLQQQSVMLKPHVWISEEGWPGEYTLSNESDWRIWESSYREYIIDFAVLADSLDVELFCVGTEFRHAAVERPNFWRELIRDVRSKFSGKVIYAANWDNYEKIKFWDQLDYIGIDAYFPLDTAKHPSKSTLMDRWHPLKLSLSTFSEQQQKAVLFTEYGYRSVCRTAGPHWEWENYPFDQETQHTAYQAFFESVWKEQWFAGGFLWKWRFIENAGGLDDRGFTPQGKKAAATIANYYRTDAIRDDNLVGR